MTKDNTASSEERRVVVRHQVRKDARLLFVDQPCFVECVIRDMSEDGALLSMLVPVALPPVVLLWEERTGAIRECEVKWRKGSMVGVGFTDTLGRAKRRQALDRTFAPLKNIARSAASLH